VVPGYKRWSDSVDNQHPNLQLRTCTLDRSQRAEAHQDDGGRFGWDGSGGVQPQQLGQTPDYERAGRGFNASGRIPTGREERPVVVDTMTTRSDAVVGV
jgi:hypothetical protein